VIACDGANSDTRRMVGAEFTGQFFQDRFLIADVVMKAGFPTERWFWFDPPFHRGQSVLLHKQADNVWRIDFQLGWDADPEEEKKPENVIPRIQAMLGPEAEFELEWVSVYQFACRRIDRFRHGRVLFAGDAAHQVSPFGARGANTGVQDIDNLVWKLASWCSMGWRRPSAGGQLPRRARLCGRRQPAQLHPLHRLHHAQERGQPAHARCGAGAGARASPLPARWSTAAGCPRRRPM
jgi:2-polyprenyl-6-methoxyphenol hydroxylase-like FAD-dependent oxidoreductase